MPMSMNTASSGSGRVDDIKSHPQGEIRGATNLVKITVYARRFAAEQKTSKERAVQVGLSRKAREFTGQERAFI
jgi:hypothetical protein